MRTEQIVMASSGRSVRDVSRWWQLLRVALLGACVAVLSASDASAHFLFLRVGPHAEAGRAVEVYFSERAEAGDPRFVDKIAHTALWLQKVPGEFEELTVRKGTDRLRAGLDSDDTVSVTGSCIYGVLQRDVAFLLKHSPKGIAGDPAKLNGLRPRKEMSLEVVPHVEKEGIRLSVLHNGKPVPRAVFTTVDDDLVNEELTADERGELFWKPAHTGEWSIYTRVTIPKSGEHDGKRYTEIREFATLALRWPLGRHDADEQAVMLFEQAVASRASWKDFPGFTASVRGTADGRSFSGTIRIDAEGKATVDLGDSLAQGWVEGQLRSIVLHRLASQSQGERPVLRFADDDQQHPLGRLLTFDGGQFASSYRVKDGQITVVNRNLGEKNMSIIVLDSEKTPEGKYLPRSYSVQYWRASDGQTLRSETIQNRWVRVGDWDLPAAITVTESTTGILESRGMEISGHRLLEK